MSERLNLSFLASLIVATGSYLRADVLPAAQQAQSTDFKPPSIPIVDEAVVLDRFVVNAPKIDEDRLRNLTSLIKGQQSALSIEEGGMIMRKWKDHEIEFGAKRTFDIFSDSAKFSDKSPLPRIDIFHFKF